MIVFISDLHLTDGTSGETIQKNAFGVFRERLRDLAYDASWRKDGKYRPIDEIHVVLLGDILDVIRSARWLDGATRPWSSYKDSAFKAKLREITAGILENNKDTLRVLRSLDDGHTTTLPPATSEGKPALVSRDPAAAERVRVKVNIHYLAGNHDWFFHLPGADYDAVRQQVATAMGLSNRPGEPFPHDPNESAEVLRIYEQHRVFARHGDVFDSFNYEQDRNASSLGDAIVVELLNRFSIAVAEQLGTNCPAECITGLREIDNVRPLLLVPVWVNGLLRRTCPDPVAKEIKKIWDGLVDRFLALDFVRERDSIFNVFDDVDKLEWALKFSKGVSLKHLSALLCWIAERTVHRDENFYRNALGEPAFKNRSAQFLVYGHTHHHEIVGLDLTPTGTSVVEQMYLNSGTWRAVQELARVKPADQEFLGFHVLTYLAFFKEDERMGRGFESWSGALAKA